jgi:hypothetical protein
MILPTNTIEGALPPPPGIIPNFAHPDKTVWTASVVTQALCLVVVGVLMGLRIYVRTSVTKNFGKDDCRFIQFHTIDRKILTIANRAMYIRLGTKMAFRIPLDRIF